MENPVQRTAAHLDLPGMSGYGSTISDWSMGDELFRCFSDLIYRTAGIRVDLRRKGLITSRLSKRIRKLGIAGFAAYYRLLKDMPDEMVEMLNCISTNTTRFFREPHHFDHLKDRIMPELFEVADERPLRIWSAGCSTGEEPYSIAITILESLRSLGIDPGQRDIKVLATDLSTNVLDIARSGIYEISGSVEGLPQDLMSRYFLCGRNGQEGRVQVKKHVREMVRFARLNLKDETFPFSRKFDAIFCRNVMIYFDEAMKQQVIGKFHEHLSDQGHLFLGHSETMLNSERFSSVNITVYRKI